MVATICIFTGIIVFVLLRIGSDKLLINRLRRDLSFWKTCNDNNFTRLRFLEAWIEKYIAHADNMIELNRELQNSNERLIQKCIDEGIIVPEDYQKAIDKVKAESEQTKSQIKEAEKNNIV